MPRSYTTRQNDMVDAIAAWAYGSEHGGTTEAILQANDGLADYGPLLPENLVITLPDIALPAPASLSSVSLWS
jgi:phage tail protein X